MPRITVEWLANRTQAQREALVEKITEVVVQVAEVKPEQVTIVFKESPLHLWAKGGVFATELFGKK